MMRLLHAVGRDETESLFRALGTLVWWDPPLPDSPEEERAEIAARFAAAVRLLVPEPPVPTELLSAYARVVRWPAGNDGWEWKGSLERLERGEWPTRWITACAGAGREPLWGEWGKMPARFQVRVLAYVAPAALADALLSLHVDTREFAVESREEGDENDAAALERYAAGALASMELLHKGREKEAADAFDDASTDLWRNAKYETPEVVEEPWRADLMRLRPSLADLLAGLDRVRGRAR
jgi:hypothetical protein